MKVLIAEDEPISRRRLDMMVRRWGYDAITVEDGEQALRVLQGTDEPLLILSDVQMPHLSGDELCRLARRDFDGRSFYIILLTASKISVEDTVHGLLTGANDYLIKPYEDAELHARLRVGERVLSLEVQLRQKVAQLENAASHIKQLETLLPICSYCKQIRDDRNEWHGIEMFVGARLKTRFSHGICPHCLEKHFGEFQRPAA